MGLGTRLVMSSAGYVQTLNISYSLVPRTTQLSISFPYCKQWKAGQGLGMRLHKLHSVNEVSYFWRANMQLRGSCKAEKQLLLIFWH